MSDEINLDEMLDDPERKVEEYGGWKFGERVRLNRDWPNECLHEGEEGRLLIEVVGAEEYKNLRTGIFFVLDGTDGTAEIPTSHFARI